MVGMQSVLDRGFVVIRSTFFDERPAGASAGGDVVEQVVINGSA